MTLGFSTDNFINKEYISNKETVSIGNEKNAKRVIIFDSEGNELINYKVSDVDDESSVQYFGLINESGSWIIKKYDNSTS